MKKKVFMTHGIVLVTHERERILFLIFLRILVHVDHVFILIYLMKYEPKSYIHCSKAKRD